MKKPIKIIVKATENLGDDAPTVEDLLSQIRDQVDILEEIDDNIGEKGKPQLVWRVTNISKNSPITFELTPYPKEHGMDIVNRAQQVVSAVARGLVDLTEGEERPKHFTDKILNRVSRLNKRVTNGLVSTEMNFENYEEVPNISIAHPSARKVLTKVESLSQPSAKPYRELGSVEGFVKTVGRDGYGRQILSLTTRLENNDIKCATNANGLDKIGHLEVEKVTKGLRLRVHGILHYKALGVLDRVDVERVELFPPSDTLPRVEDLIDRDFTNGVESVEFIRQVRNNGYSD